LLTPVDLETTVFRRGFRGYNTGEVQDFMENFGHDYEQLYRENIELKEQLEELQKKLSQYQTIEETLRNTMILAEETAEEAKTAARERAAQIVRESELQAEATKIKVKQDLQNELRHLALLKNQVEYFKCQFKGFLNGLLEMAEKQLDLTIEWQDHAQNMAAATLEKEQESDALGTQKSSPESEEPAGHKDSRGK
jgi:cell division initiation protein